MSAGKNWSASPTGWRLKPNALSAWRVQKVVEGGRTTTRVERLENSALLDELALMLGNLSDASRTAAREALEVARQRSKELAQAK